MIEHPAQKLFHTLLAFVNFDVSTIGFWIVEEWNGVDPRAVLIMLQDWGFWKFSHKKNLFMVSPLFGSLFDAHVYDLTKTYPYLFLFN